MGYIIYPANLIRGALGCVPCVFCACQNIAPIAFNFALAAYFGNAVTLNADGIFGTIVFSQNPRIIASSVMSCVQTCMIEFGTLRFLTFIFVQDITIAAFVCICPVTGVANQLEMIVAAVLASGFAFGTVYGTFRSKTIASEAFFLNCPGVLFAFLNVAVRAADQLTVGT